MSIIDNIKNRRSVRSYTGVPLSTEHVENINNYIKSLKSPFGTKVHIELVHKETAEKPIKLGTYGTIGKACDFLTLAYEEAPLSEEGAAYTFEQVILFCTELDLGTCWLGGSFNKKDFQGSLELNPNEKLKIVSPVGYISDKKTIFETLINAPKKHLSRKPFGTFFFENNFNTPLTEEKAGNYLQPLEMVRIAPSASNTQPWRILLRDGILHFYHHQSMGGFSAIDSGIALCHFEQTCIALGIPGKFAVLADAIASDDVYSASWVQA